jgi:tetratricopeptide (TPR) repeat protein
MAIRPSYTASTGSLDPTGRWSFQERTAQAVEGQLQLMGRRQGELVTANEVVLREFQQQTDALWSMHEEQVSAQTRSTREIVDGMQGLEESLCDALTDVRWALDQQQATLDGILNTLQNRRAAEASELVRFGVRLLNTGDVLEAEQQFQKALEQNPIDYQVLLNLGLIASIKGELEQACRYCDMAVRRPIELDAPARVRALWFLAEAELAANRPGAAYAAAKQAHELSEGFNTAKTSYETGVYAVVAAFDGAQSIDSTDEASTVRNARSATERGCNDKTLLQAGLHLVKKAVLENPKSMAAAIADWRLDDAAQCEIQPLMSQIADEAIDEFNELMGRLNAQIAELDKSRFAQGFRSPVADEYRTIVAACTVDELAPSYSETRRLILSVKAILKSLSTILRSLELNIGATVSEDEIQGELRQAAVQRKECDSLEENRKAADSIINWSFLVGLIIALLFLLGLLLFSCNRLCNTPEEIQAYREYRAYQGEDDNTPDFPLIRFVSLVGVVFIFLIGRSASIRAENRCREAHERLNHTQANYTRLLSQRKSQKENQRRRRGFRVDAILRIREFGQELERVVNDSS